MQYAVSSDCVRKGVKSAVIISGGLAETGEEGARIQRETVEIARRGGIRFIGPTCLGFCNPYANFCTVPFMPPIEAGHVALISQSPNSGQAILDYGLLLGMGFSKFISSGNEADLQTTDFLEALADDPATEVILSYLEGVRDGRSLLGKAKMVSRQKPFIMVKAGQTDAGVKAAFSHTGALSGSDDLFGALFSQAGVIRAETIEEAIGLTPLTRPSTAPRRRRGVAGWGRQRRVR